MQTYDLIAVGGGTAGLVASAGAAGLGARVALVEADRLGGDCLWTGCVPSKALIAAARAAAGARRAAALGVDAGAAVVDFPRVMQWVREAQRRIEPHDSPERFRALGVDVVQGTARFSGPRTLAVDGRRLTAKRVVIATGSRPAVPPIAGLEAVPFHTNETVFSLEGLPRALLVLGGGPIGVELAQAFARLGSNARVVEALPQLLPNEDDELVAMLSERLAADGVEVHTGTTVRAVSREGDGVRLEAARLDGTTVTLDGDALLVATGRRSNVDALELGRAGVEAGTDGVVVDRALRTTADGIWAAGDVTGGLRFTHVADYEARLVVRNAFFPLAGKADYSAVPWVTFTDPELAHVGLTERQARERFGDTVRVWRRPFAEVDRAIADGEPHGMVKLITTRRGKLLGGHVLGHGAGSVLAEVALAMRHGLSVTKLASTVHAYPTYAEAVRQAAEEFYKAKFTGAVKSAAKWLATR